MIITRTPFRMSFFDGGTDMEAYFYEHRGAVLSTTFDKYCYVTVRHLPGFFDYSTEVAYSRIERVTDVEKIEHPAVRNAMKMMDIRQIRLTYEADLPARSGIGTSSSFAVGMLNAFHALKGECADRKTLADEAIFLERTLCAEQGGWQDQIAAAYGGLNRIDFCGGQYRITEIEMPVLRKKQLNENLMMFFTGFCRYSSEIQQSNHVAARKNHDLLGRMYELVGQAEEILKNPERDLDEFGYLLGETWKMKRMTGTHISTDGIDRLYDKGMEAGALGGKLLGAGSGGFLVFYVPEERREAVRTALKDLLYIPFAFENSGSKVLYAGQRELPPR